MPYHRTDPNHRSIVSAIAVQATLVTTKKYQAKAEYRIGKVQRTNCGTHPNKQRPCGQADAPQVQLEAPLGEVAGGFGRDSIGGNTNYIFTILHLRRGDLQRNQGTKGRLIRLRPSQGNQPPVVQRRTWEAPDTTPGPFLW